MAVYDKMISLFCPEGKHAKGGEMAAYMKNNFAFLGIAKPDRVKLQASFTRIFSLHNTGML